MREQSAPGTVVSDFPRHPVDRAGGRRSPITAPGYRRGMRPPNKGLKLPAEPLDLPDVNALLSSFGSSRTDIRNYAMVILMYRATLRIGEIVGLERRHFDTRRHRLIIPATPRLPERTMKIDAPTQQALDKWIEIRKAARIPAAAPLFCTITAGTQGRRLHTSYIRELLKAKATSLGIDRRVTPEGLRRSGKDHREHARRRIDAQVGQYLDEASFRLRHPDAYERWQSALDLFEAHPQRHATRIGHDCREALVSFADTALAAADIAPMPGAGTVQKLRALIEQVGVESVAVVAHTQALVSYWGTVSDLAQRQEHAASREKEDLTTEDARRLVFHTMLVMFEVDRLCGDNRH